ncbi:MAG: hypothetical protein AAF383_19925 [Cyanobacteria bacterium P01_A01_bin.83]
MVCSGSLIFLPQASSKSQLLTKNQGNEPLPEEFSCPDNINKLTGLLLNDLPSYSNRVIQRTQDLNQDAGIENYIVTASAAEFEPLGLPRIQYSPLDDQDPQQIFFTVLERQYLNNKIVDIQTYHWLFLTQTDSGWRTVMMFSRYGNSTTNTPPTPPRETTNGIIGRGVQLWLRDCRAGTIRV